MASVTYGTVDEATRGVLIYNTSSTNTTVTITAKAQFQAQKKYQSTYKITASISGGSTATKDPIDLNTLYASWNTYATTSEISRTVTKTTSAQNITVSSSYSGSSNGSWLPGPRSGNTSATVTVPALASYTISYNANGGSGAPGSQTKYYGITLKLSSTVPTKTGYTFKGWATSSSATSAAYSAGGNYTANAGATLYAVWQANTYTITYNNNGGSGSANDQTKTYGVALTLRIGSDMSKAGHTLQKWNTNSGGTGTSYPLGGSYTANAGATLYAVWQANTYTISYNKNTTDAVSNMPSSQTKTHGVALTLRSNVPTRSGYTFLGWSASNSATSATWQAGGTYAASNNANATLYAIWKVAYASPTIKGYNNKSIPTVYRTNKNGTLPVDDGGYVYAAFDWSVFAGYEGYRAYLQYKNAGGDWQNLNTSPKSISGSSGSVIFTGTCPIVDGNEIPFDTDTSYEIRLAIRDTYSSNSYYMTTLSTAYFTLDFRAGGKAIGVGTAAPDPSGYSNGLLQVAMALQDGDGNYIDSLRHSKLIPNSSDLNDYKEPGIYYIQSNANAQTLENCPAIRAFYLIIFGNQKSGASNFGVLTQKIITFIGEEYVRYYNHWNSSPAWTDWVMTGGVDCIIEQGTSGIWRFEKRRNGKAECWGKTTVTGTFTTARNAVYAIDTLDTTSANFPSSLFNTTPAFCSVTGQNASSWNFPVGFVYSLSSSSVSFFPVMTGKIQTSATFTYYIHAIGTWK